MILTRLENFMIIWEFRFIRAIILLRYIFKNNILFNWEICNCQYKEPIKSRSIIILLKLDQFLLRVINHVKIWFQDIFWLKFQVILTLNRLLNPEQTHSYILHISNSRSSLLHWRQSHIHIFLILQIDNLYLCGKKSKRLG